jgi:hypothetical protein
MALRAACCVPGSFDVRHRMPETTLSRFLYRWSVFLALPGGMWAAFEMYGLTLRGSQMLFFSIAHTMFPLVLAVWLSVPMGVAWLAQSAVGVVYPAYQAKLLIPHRALTIFAVAIGFHAAALVWYESWSVTAGRVPICLLGLFLSALVVREVWREVRPTSSRALSRVAESDA